MSAAKRSLMTVSEFGGTVAKTSARSVVRLPSFAPFSAAVSTSRNFCVFSSVEPGIFDIAAFTSARYAVWSAAESCFMTAVIEAGSAMTSPIFPRASASVMALSWATSVPASAIAITISSFFIFSSSFVED